MREFSLLFMMTMHLKGFGMRLNPGTVARRSWLLGQKKDKSGLFHFWGLLDPLPTTLRQVSGNKIVKPSKHTAPIMVNIQKIQGQPALSARIPPTTGPRLGPVFGLSSDQQNTYFDADHDRLLAWS